MTRLPAGAAQRRGRRRRRARRDAAFWSRGARRRGRARRRRAGAGAPVGHRAARAGDGRGAPTPKRPRARGRAPGGRWCEHAAVPGRRPARLVAISRPCAGSSASSAGAATCAVPDAAAAGRRSSTAPCARSRGEPTATPTRTADLTGRLDAAAAAVEAVDAALRGVPGVRALLGDPQAALLVEDRHRAADAAGSTRSSASSTTVSAARSPPRRSRRSTPRWSRCKDAVWAVGRDRLRTAREVAGARRRRSVGRGARGVPLGAGRAVGASTGSRCAVATRPGCTCSCAGHGLDLADPTIGRLVDGAHRRPAVRFAARCAPPATSSRSSTRPRPRSASSATTPRCCAPPIRDDELLAPRARGRRRRGDGARPHALGERRHHLRGERAPAQPRGARRPRPARTWWPRSTATSTTTPTSRRSRACRCPPRSPPTPR